MQQFEGIGGVLENDREIAQVEYNLVKTLGRTDTGRGIVEGPSETRGHITLLSGSIRMGNMYMLRLDSGKEVEFFADSIKDRRYEGFTYHVIVNGDPEA